MIASDSSHSVPVAIRSRKTESWFVEKTTGALRWIRALIIRFGRLLRGTKLSHDDHKNEAFWENRHGFYEPNCYYGNKKLLGQFFLRIDMQYENWELKKRFRNDSRNDSAVGPFHSRDDSHFTINNFMEYFDVSRLVALWMCFLWRSHNLISLHFAKALWIYIHTRNRCTYTPSSPTMYSHPQSPLNIMSRPSSGFPTMIEAQSSKAVPVAGKKRRFKARRRNSVVIHRKPVLFLSPKSLAPKKMIRARYAADELSTPTVRISPIPVSPQTPFRQNPISLFRSISSDEISVVSHEETEEKAKVVSDQDLSTCSPSTPMMSIGASRNTVWSSPSKTPQQQRTTPKITPTKKSRKTKQFLSVKTAAEAEEEAAWMTMFRKFVDYKIELAAYQRKHDGATQYSNKDHQFLSHWVMVQRRQHAQKGLSERRTKLLESVGVVL